MTHEFGDGTAIAAMAGCPSTATGSRPASWPSSSSPSCARSSSRRTASRVNVDFILFDRDARTWVVIIVSMALGALLAEFVRLALKRRRQSTE